MVRKLIILLLVMFAAQGVASARDHEFAVGVNGSTYVDNGPGSSNPSLWQIGAQGEYRLKLIKPLWLNSILTVDYYNYKATYILVGSQGELDHVHDGGVAFQLTEYANLRLPKGWAIGTGPALRVDTNELFSSDTKLKVYWTFGVEKSFLQRFTARVMWNQKVSHMDILYNQLNFSLTYSF